MLVFGMLCSLCPELLLEHPWGHLGLSWAILKPPWSHLAPNWAYLGPSLGLPGVILAEFTQNLLGHFLCVTQNLPGQILRNAKFARASKFCVMQNLLRQILSMGHLGPSCGHLWGILGLSSAYVGATLGYLGAILGPSWACWGLFYLYFTSLRSQSGL